MHSLSILSTLLLLGNRVALAYVGDMTYYNPGTGSCGIPSSDADAVVALSKSMMNNPANPNANPKCGTSIHIFNPATGKTHYATVVDTCRDCAPQDIDLTLSLFREVAPDGDGRVHGIAWGWQRVGGRERYRKR
ncbi:hypothetical protein MMC07_003942 [Pseudocyphellaria aurata]|nr:hypothetical protein [Pseudocyphellaria aurata]